jgi:hypothetical protein
MIWLGPGYLLGEDRTFEFGSADSEFHLTGVLGPARASGELEITQGDCTTGVVQWEAHKTDPLT